MNTAKLELAIACIGALAWLVQTALTDPVEAALMLGLIYLVVHLTRQYHTRRRQLPAP